MRNRAKAALMAGIVAVASVGVGIMISVPEAHAATQICDQYGTTVVGNYIVQNNRWGTSATQCINVTSTGFSIVQQDGTGNTSGAPVSYPSIYLGCHYSNCSPSSPLPKQISTISSANTSISDTYPSSGTYDASYDIWLNADTNVSGVQDTEIMVWLNHTGSIQPVGSNSGQTVNIAGHSWAVWTGNNGQNNVVSYVQAGISSLSFDVMAFVRDTLSRGSQYGTNAWYLTSIQAGFEPWIGGVGLAVNNFSASVTGGTPPTTTRPPTTAPPTTRPPTTPPTTSTSRPPTGSGCTASYAITNQWNPGFGATVTVTNGSTARTSWTVSWTFANGQTITQIWNATDTANGASHTVRNLSYNGSLAPNASTTFGFNGTWSGTNSVPTLSCS
jgi:hypothetical protein